MKTPTGHPTPLLPSVTHIQSCKQETTTPKTFLCDSKVKATGFAPVPPWSSNVENYHPISEVIVTGVCGRSLFFLEFVASEDQLWLQNR